MLVIKEQVPLHQYTTLQVGGVADYMVEAWSVEEVREALLFAATHTKVPPLILGGGSNLLVSDDGYAGVVIHMNIKGVTYSDRGDDVSVLTVGAGEAFDDVVSDTIDRGLWGLENLSAIPGSVGATPVQNVGAYGVEVSMLIESVTALNTNTTEEKIFSNEECQFSYRDSFFKTPTGKEWVIVAVTFVVSKVPTPRLAYADLASLVDEVPLTPGVVRKTVQAIRSKKFPDWNTVGTAGSFFKNPCITSVHFNQLKQQYPELPGYDQGDGTVKVSLGYVLDKVCGLRGYCDGAVCLFERQALVLVNTGGATAADIKKFSENISEKVFAKTHIHIEQEVVSI